MQAIELESALKTVEARRLRILSQRNLVRLPRTAARYLGNAQIDPDRR
jgi:hypothetical protein